WYLEPGMEGSEQLVSHVLIPGMSLNLHFVGGAGSEIQAPGDYLFFDRRQPFQEAGLWNILRVTDDGVSGGTDTVRVNEMKTLFGPDGQNLQVAGVLSPRPAGDTADRVSIYSGQMVGGRCTGALIGTAPVDSGSGRFELRKAVSTAPDEVCVQSSAGGALQGAFTP
ncbi:MAG: hypothetical protein KDD47_06025, partial [Acidobacteria bacterium]|nr:hypothetical protein [Acidobacteriota bacterium]